MPFEPEREVASARSVSPSPHPTPMNIHEFQAKQLLAKYDVIVPQGIELTDPEKAGEAFDELGKPVAVV